jgi:hypothetical protein
MANRGLTALFYIGKVARYPTTDSVPSEFHPTTNCSLPNVPGPSQTELSTLFVGIWG